MAALFRRKASGRPGEWYYCLRHRTVEEGPDCPGKDRFGPYATRGEAERAMETAHERDAAWRHDPRWNDRDEADRDEADD
ncbi:hypothetical protein [Streptomyces radicis]|uniref:SPOR domain-containing protein n=1 Tax=Streptomyces radicis TaxID=1750517 RepID=A0A3A9WGJ8_9ACTN|nr:hypothetical protein [Streptomyces radicis]RKN12158.1 hypothetical protein D7319_04600 [Streptomyces radicis]RKN25789.1 hypothetical protein D7318_05880 [Streptomyces radicis]